MKQHHLLQHMLSEEYRIFCEDILLTIKPVIDSLESFIRQAFVQLMHTLHLLFAIDNNSIVFIFLRKIILDKVVSRLARDNMETECSGYIFNTPLKFIYCMLQYRIIYFLFYIFNFYIF